VSSARAGRSAQLGRGHGCGALTREENGGKKDGGVLGLVSTEKVQQHWKQAAEKETEYDDMRAQLNKIKFKLF
jgi:hypothetical protein